MFEDFWVFFEVLGFYFFFYFWGFFEVFLRFLRAENLKNASFCREKHFLRKNLIEVFLRFLRFFWGFFEVFLRFLRFFLRFFNFWGFLRAFFSQKQFLRFWGFSFLKTHFWGLETNFWRNSPKLLSLRKEREREREKREREFSEVSETWRNFRVFVEMLRMWDFLRLGVISERFVVVETFWGFGVLT